MKKKWTLITNNYLKVTDIIKSASRPQKTAKNPKIKLYEYNTVSDVMNKDIKIIQRSFFIGPLKQETQEV
jgi:hypothetical protein